MWLQLPVKTYKPVARNTDAAYTGLLDLDFYPNQAHVASLHIDRSLRD
jgi:hypothetical protein